MLSNKDFKPKMLFAICFQDKTEWLLEKLKAADAHSITVNYATGVKKSNLLDMLGISDNKRILITAVLNEKDVPSLFEVLGKKLYHVPNTGLAFTVNVDAYAGAKSMVLIDAFLKNYLDSIDDDDEQEEEDGNE